MDPRDSNTGASLSRVLAAWKGRQGLETVCFRFASACGFSGYGVLCQSAGGVSFRDCFQRDPRSRGILVFSAFQVVVRRKEQSQKSKTITASRLFGSLFSPVFSLCRSSSLLRIPCPALCSEPLCLARSLRPPSLLLVAFSLFVSAEGTERIPLLGLATRQSLNDRCVAMHSCVPD
ncbi:hypothetical protein TGGT1_408790 [Toxoplasma gondii GT1]|uniref:Uncharacterized protein n=1 Tax=Toxoplasma gondii (strain ATCC 50853 / GT1) TaxID=507601 RepID=S7V0B2_TOXGG|nr:hypothetical protein TGGT1_408790 [Toxoplasma gondii GT1]